MASNTRSTSRRGDAQHRQPALSSPPLPLPHDRQQVDPLVSAVHAAFHSLSTSLSSNHQSPSNASELDMGRSPALAGKEKQLDIVVATDQLILRGTGVDVEPALLSGNVVLNLLEPASIKQISLVFRGKARVPSTSPEPCAFIFFAVSFPANRSLTGMF